MAAAKPLTEGAFLNPKRPSPQKGERQDPFHRALRSHMLTACIALGILDSRRDERECFAMT